MRCFICGKARSVVRNVRVVGFTGDEKARQEQYQGGPIEVTLDKSYRQKTRLPGTCPRYDSYKVIAVQDVNKASIDHLLSKTSCLPKVNAVEGDVIPDSGVLGTIEEIEELEDSTTLFEQWVEAVCLTSKRLVSLFVTRSYASNDDVPLSTEEILYASSALAVSFILLILDVFQVAIRYLQQPRAVPDLSWMLVKTLVAFSICLYILRDFDIDPYNPLVSSFEKE